MISCADKRSGHGARRECGVDVDNPRPAWIEANRNLNVWALDLDFPLPVERERTRPTPKRDFGAVIEEPGVGDGNRAEKTRRNRDRYGSRGRHGITDHDPGARAAIAGSWEEGSANAGDTYCRGEDAGEHDLPQM